MFAVVKIAWTFSLSICIFAVYIYSIKTSIASFGTSWIVIFCWDSRLPSTSPLVNIALSKNRISYGTMPRGRRGEHTCTPCAGVRSDFNKLLKLFADSNSVRYEQFAEIWRDMKMSFIFTGRYSEMELREFTEDILRIAAELWLPPANFQNRVGALYLLYGLYFKQLSEPRCKIRVTIEMWQDILTFMDEVKRQQHLDVEYCFHKLCYNRAFHYVAHPVEQIRSRETTQSEETKTKEELDKIKRMALVEERSIMSEILEQNSIDQLSAIHEQYHQMKCDLSGSNSSVPDRSLNIIEANLVQHITKAVTTFEDWRKKKAGGQKTGRKRKDSGASGTSESDGDSHSESETGKPKSPGQRRAEIRTRAFGSAGKSTRGRRHRHIGKRLSELGESPGTPKKKKMKVKQEPTEDIEPIMNIKTEEWESAVLDMPMFSSAEPTPTRKGKERRSPGAAKSKKGSVANPTKSPVKIVLKEKKFKSSKEET